MTARPSLGCRFRGAMCQTWQPGAPGMEIECSPRWVVRQATRPNRGPKIVILSVADGRLAIERVIAPWDDAPPRIGPHTIIYQPRLVRAGERVGFWVSRPTVGKYYGECDLAAHDCLIAQVP